MWPRPFPLPQIIITVSQLFETRGPFGQQAPNMKPFYRGQISAYCRAVYGFYSCVQVSEIRWESLQSVAALFGYKQIRIKSTPLCNFALQKLAVSYQQFVFTFMSKDFLALCKLANPTPLLEAL